MPNKEPRTFMTYPEMLMYYINSQKANLEATTNAIYSINDSNLSNHVKEMTKYRERIWAYEHALESYEAFIEYQKEQEGENN